MTVRNPEDGLKTGCPVTQQVQHDKESSLLKFKALSAEHSDTFDVPFISSSHSRRDYNQHQLINQSVGQEGLLIILVSDTGKGLLIWTQLHEG